MRRTSAGWLRRVFATNDEQQSSKRLATQAEMIVPHLDEHGSVLDVGCGRGLLASHLKRLAGCQVIGIDVADARRASGDAVLFDGCRLPFPDASIDYGVLSFVLHHSTAPLAMCNEIQRVVRRKVFIFEDVPSSWYQRGFLATHIIFFSWLYRLPWPARRPWALPYLQALDAFQSFGPTTVVELPTMMFRRSYPIVRKLYIVWLAEGS